MSRPNIVYLHSHDTGRCIAPYGHAVPTPHLQKLADQGVLFRQAFSCAPTCSPSRAALLTGQCPHACGMLGLAHRGWVLNDYGKHLAHTLGGAGHHTALFGMQHVAPRDNVAIAGYHEVARLPNAQARHVAPAAAAWLAQAPVGPFFLDIGFFETHRTYPDTTLEEGKSAQPPASIADTPATRADMAAYKKSARDLDNGIGEVLAALDAAGLAEGTLVICTTDHGLAFPGMKCNLTDRGLGVLLMMRGPRGCSGGRVVDAMVSHLDIYPTLCELLELPAPSWLEGRSLWPLLDGTATEIHEELFGEVTFHAAYEPQRSVRTSRWKYIRRFDSRRTPVLANCDDSPSKDLWLEHGWAARALPEELLFDLIFDPGEVCNLAGTPDHAAVLDDMRDRLDRWMHATSDPLLAGPVAPAPGTQMNSQDDLSPRMATIAY